MVFVVMEGILEGSAILLAYLFWHTPKDGVDRAVYEVRLRAFHEALRASHPNGLLHTSSFAVKGALWLCGTISD